MSYTAPYIDATGLSIPTYNDIVTELVAQARAIFGQDIYLDNDSQDYQFISIIAYKIYDSMQLSQLVYNNQSPLTSVGTGLDSIVKFNGLVRKVATYASCPVVLSGLAGTVVNNGVVQDTNGNQWSLPASISLGISGTATVTATCTVPGAVTAGIGTITKIVTPTLGWTSVNNIVAATPGIDAETDSQLKARQFLSTSLSGDNLLTATCAAIASLLGVTRFAVYENDTAITDVKTIPSHSIAAVVENGDQTEIAQAIFDKKGPGCGTYGTTTVTLTDSFNQVVPINFYRPSYVDIDVVVAVHALPGYTTAMTAAIKNALESYLNSLSIGASLSWSMLWAAAISAMADIKSPTFSITALTCALHGGSQGTADITVAFNKVTRGNAAYITVNVS